MQCRNEREWLLLKTKLVFGGMTDAPITQSSIQHTKYGEKYTDTRHRGTIRWRLNSLIIRVPEGKRRR